MGTYLVLLFSLYSFLKIVNLLDITLLLSSFIFIWILMIMILLDKEKWVKTTSYFVMIVPILDIIHYLEFEPVWRSISFSILILYGTFLFLKFVCKDLESKNIFALIGMILSILIVFFENDSMAGIYIGFVGFIAIFIGFYQKELKSLFYAGIVITIINILYRLRDFWKTIPFWLYLLFGGLALIGFVTYKEIHKMNHKD